jgi:hypothetical protein
MGTLEQTIETHRELYRSDLFIDRLVARQPPTTLDLNTGILHVEDGTRIGMTMSGRLLKYVGHPEGYGADFPWSKALWLVRSWCRREHRRRYHSVEKHWDGALCHQLVKYVVIRGWSVENAGKIMGYDNPEPLLREAFQFIEDRMDDFRARAEQRAKEDEGRALTCRCGHSWSRHENPATMFRCVSCECHRYHADAKAA